MSDALRHRCAIAVMAKAPRVGRVKTRLCPPLMPEEATDLSAAFLRDITDNLREAAKTAPIDAFIAFAPAGDDHAFDGILAEGTKLFVADGEMDDVPLGVTGFGRSLLHAMRTLFARGYGGAVVLNSDSPTLPTEFLARTATELVRGGQRAVLGPADDGGYYLLGLQAPHARAFADIAWSTDVVADQTRARVGEIGIELVELPVWYDVDNEAALRQLVTDLTTPSAHDSPPYPAMTTAACLERLGLPSRIAA